MGCQFMNLFMFSYIFDLLVGCGMGSEGPGFCLGALAPTQSAATLYSLTV